MNFYVTGLKGLPILQLLLGSSACVLHYIENNKSCNDGEVILMDFGAENM